MINYILEKKSKIYLNRFMNNQLTQSIEDYIEAIYILELKGEKIKSVTIAHLLNVSKPAVSKAMKELLELGFIEMKPYGDIILSESGRKEAKRIYASHTTIYDFLISLGVSKEKAEIDCCKIEHIISKETLEAFKRNTKK